MDKADLVRVREGLKNKSLVTYSTYIIYWQGLPNFCQNLVNLSFNFKKTIFFSMKTKILITLKKIKREPYFSPTTHSLISILRADHGLQACQEQRAHRRGSSKLPVLVSEDQERLALLRGNTVLLGKQRRFTWLYPLLLTHHSRCSLDTPH